jgi:hypothetical protein
VLLEIFLSYAVNTRHIDRPALQLEEPEVDCMGLCQNCQACFGSCGSKKKKKTNRIVLSIVICGMVQLIPVNCYVTILGIQNIS